jgi:hypothetical protein
MQAYTWLSSLCKGSGFSVGTEAMPGLLMNPLLCTISCRPTPGSLPSVRGVDYLRGLKPCLAW